MNEPETAGRSGRPANFDPERRAGFGAGCSRPSARLWVSVTLLALLCMALLQGALHEFFMRLPMLEYHLVSAVLTAIVVAVAAILYVQWRCTALTAREALRRLRASEALRDDLTSMLVHDLKNPLAGALLVSKMLLARSQGLDDQERGMLGMAVRSQERLISMIEDLLDVARAEAGKLPVNFTDSDLADVIESALSEAAPSAEQAGVHLSKEIGACPTVPSDADKVHRVMGNLLSNAIKYTPQGGTVTVSLRCTAEEALVSVEDTGQGIPAGFHERIFDKFEQASVERARLSVGLGLTFCKFAIEAQGGRIWTESTPGEGSTFTFSLPLARSQHSPAQPGGVPRLV